MAPPRGWADLPPEILLCITDHLATLRCYLAVRDVCAAWRSALAPATPFLLFVVPEDRRAVAVSLPLDRKFHLAMSCNSWCVGSSDGWLALAATQPGIDRTDVHLLKPLSGQEVALPVLPHLATSTFTPWFVITPHRFLRWPVRESKVVFAPNPRKDDFAAVVVVKGQRTLASVRAGDAEWSVQEIGRWEAPLADVVHHDGKLYCLTGRGNVLVEDESTTGNRAHVFAMPYARLSDHVYAKYLVFCEGHMYQIWRNTGDAFSLRLPRGGCFHVSKNELFVFKHAPGRRSCWEAAADLGGHAAFVGQNNAVSVRAEAVPGIKGNCVYWMCQYAYWCTSMEFDLQTRKSAPCVEWQEDALCWYLLGLGDVGASSKNENGEILQRQQKRMELGV